MVEGCRPPAGGTAEGVPLATTDETMSETNKRASRRALLLISIATVFALSVWFSTNAIAPALETAKGLSGGDIAWLTIAVQLGFVAGTLIISFTNLADLVSARTLFGVSAIIAGVLNLAVIPLEGFGPVIAARFATGMLLGGVYPPGMKILAGWFQRGRGIALGVMIGALTLGSGSPHLLRSMFTDQWQITIVGSSILAAAGGLIVWIMVGDGPYDVRGARFSPRYVFRVITERGPRFALLGYLGHQWELYAMWAWIGAYLAAVYGARPLIGDRVDLASMLAFAVFFAGAIGSIGAGVLAERFGRSLTTAGAMVMSGSIALAIGFVPFDWGVVIAVLALL